ncbi:hypothetical protein PSTG_19875 [Puccinia striiformis f. sp. tritici PST-78]|uniref:Uncharacterized protein n=1 Tax=Puccinia striiformis f. sp. tritici PST-78 TaxID=1165861 RepID=A0A0L0UIC5_9BASI|nr:hypothetical protein PSTG_19875 [Puccinia striiformis f. sp. tritici PST-78]
MVKSLRSLSALPLTNCLGRRKPILTWSRPSSTKARILSIIWDHLAPGEDGCGPLDGGRP